MKTLGKAALGLGAVGAALLALTAYSGHQLQKTMLAQPRQWARELPFVEVHELRYDKGFFGATRVMTLKLGCPGQTRMITWRDTVSHGPFPSTAAFGAAVVDSELVLDPQLPPVTARTRIDFGGAMHTQARLPQVALTLPQGQLAVQAATFNWDETAQGAATYTLDIPSYELSDKVRGSSIKFTGMKARGHTLPGLPFAAGSIGSMDIGAIEFRGLGFDAAVRDVKLLSHTQVDDAGLLQSHSTLSGQAQLGSTQIDGFEMQASMKRVHLSSYAAVVQRLVATSCDPQALQRDPDVLQAALRQMLPHNPQVALDRLVVRHAGQQASLSSLVTIEGVTEADLRDGFTPALASKIAMQFDLNVPAAWIEASADRVGATTPVDHMLQQGFMQRNGDAFTASVRLANGTLNVNGRAIPLPGPR